MIKNQFKKVLAQAIILVLCLSLFTTLFAKENASAPLIKKAKDHLNLFQYDQAHSLLNQATQMDPNNWEPWYLMGRSLIRQKQEVQAEQFLLKAASLNSEETDIQKALGALYINLAKNAQTQGKNSEMTEFLHKACRAYPGGTKIWQSLLENWFKSGDFEKIKTEGDFIVRSNARILAQGDDKNLQSALVIVAQTFYKEGDIPNTEKYIKSASMIRQHNDDLQNLRREIRVKSESALKELVDQANSSFNKGEYDKALKLLEETEKLSGARTSEISEMMDRIKKEAGLMKAIKESDDLIASESYEKALDRLEEASLQFPEDDRIAGKLDFVRTKVDKIKAEEAKKRAAEIMARKKILEKKKQYEALIKSGLEYEKATNYEMAIINFEKALELAPTQEKLKVKLVELKEKQKEKRNQIDALAVEMTELKRLFAANNNEEAYEKASKMLLSYGENSPEIAVIQAEVCLKLDRTDEVRKFMIEFEENETYRELHSYLSGMLAYREGNREEALKYFKKIKNSNFRPDISSTTSWIYLYQYQAGIYIIILILMFPALKFGKTMMSDLKTRRMLAKIEKIRETGSYEENLSFLEERFDKGDSPNPKQITIMLAEALLRTGNHQRAYELANSIVKKDGRNANAKRIAGEACMQLGDTSPSGLEYIQGLLKLDGSRKTVVLFLSQTYINSQADHKMAQEFILEAISMNPNDNNAIVYLADVFIKRDVLTQQSLKIFEKAIKIAPDAPDYYAAIIKNLKKLDSHDEAERWLQLAREKFADEPAFSDSPAATVRTTPAANWQGGMPDYENIGNESYNPAVNPLPDIGLAGSDPYQETGNLHDEAEPQAPPVISGPIKECPHCQAHNPAKEYYCTKCGKPLG